MTTKFIHRCAIPAVIALALSCLLAFGGLAAAAATLQVTPNSSLVEGSSVTLSGSGFADNSTGGVVECNNASGQPTINVVGNPVPVSCTDPLDALNTTSATGTLSATFTVEAGVVGPPGTGTDSSGNDASADAANYPCPPTSTQQSAGVSCVVSFGDQAGDAASAPISLSGGTIPTTTTTTTATATTSTTQPATTSTTQPVCAGQRNQVTTNGVMLLVNPASCLVAGVAARIEGSGLTPNQQGSLTECSTAAGQGTVSYGSLSLPVSCAAPLTLSSNSDGSLGPAYITIGAGILGSGANASAYPCPPTAAQQAAGSTCTLAYATTTAVAVQVPISFAAQGQQTLYSGGDGSGNSKVSTAAVTSVSGAPSASPAATPAASSAPPVTSAHIAGPLAFTGPGPGLWAVCIGGLLLIDLGYLTVTVVGTPRQLLRRLRRSYRALYR
jgi:hypothetical protein